MLDSVTYAGLVHGRDYSIIYYNVKPQSQSDRKGLSIYFHGIVENTANKTVTDADGSSILYPQTGKGCLFLIPFELHSTSDGCAFKVGNDLWHDSELLQPSFAFVNFQLLHPKQLQMKCIV